MLFVSDLFYFLLPLCYTFSAELTAVITKFWLEIDINIFYTIGVNIVFVEYAEPEGAEAMWIGLVGIVYRTYKFNRVIPGNYNSIIAGVA